MKPRGQYGDQRRWQIPWYWSLPVIFVVALAPGLLTWAAADGGFTLTFPSADFTVRACATIAILRKCFDLKEIRATPSDIALDFGGGLADRRYTF
jgi:hypothetical protein